MVSLSVITKAEAFSYTEFFLAENPDVQLSSYEGEVEFYYDSRHGLGGSALAMEADGKSRGGARISVRAPAGRRYKLTIRYKTDANAVSGAARLRIWFVERDGTRVLWDDANNYVVSTSGLGEQSYYTQQDYNAWLDSTQEWKEVSIVFDMPLSAYIAVINPCNWFGRGTVWYDSLELTYFTE